MPVRRAIAGGALALLMPASLLLTVDTSAAVGSGVRP